MPASSSSSKTKAERSASRVASTALLVTDRDFLPVIQRLVKAAESTIDIFAFAFSIQESSATRGRNSAALIAQTLIDAKQSSPDLVIRIYLEGHRETVRKNQMTAKRLAKAGIEIKYGSTHVKAVGIDGRFLLMGSTNLTSQSINRNFETNVFTDHLPSVRQFTKYFDHYWNDGKHGGLSLKPPLFADQDFLPELISIINRSRQSLSFSMYFFYHDEIEEALIQAKERGVHIKGFVHSHLTFALDDVRRTASTCRRLAARGIEDLHFAPTHLFTHSKYIVADHSIAFIGTGNWIPRDVTENPQLYLKIVNKVFCSQLELTLERQISESGRRISPT